MNDVSKSVLGIVAMACATGIITAWVAKPDTEVVKSPCVCKAESCPAASACPEPPPPAECPVPAPAACPDVACTEQVVSFGDYYAQMAAQAENQIRDLVPLFETKKAELDPIFARAKELNVGPRQAWVGNPEAVSVYLSTISRIGELEAIHNRMQQVVQSVESRMDKAWYESVERRNLWSVLPRSVEPYREQFREFRENSDDQWFTYICAWEYEKRNRDGAR
jgi:hypothetical protein